MVAIIADPLGISFEQAEERANAADQAGVARILYLTLTAEGKRAGRSSDTAGPQKAGRAPSIGETCGREPILGLADTDARHARSLGPYAACRSGDFGGSGSRCASSSTVSSMPHASARSGRRW